MNLVRKQLCCYPLNQILHGRGRSGVPDDLLCACTLALINTECVSRWDVGNAEYLTGEQMLPRNQGVDLTQLPMSPGLLEVGKV